MPTDSSRFLGVSRQAFWQRHVNQWRTCELSKAAYCQLHTLKYHQMVYWCAKLQSNDETGTRAGGFVAVSVSPSSAGSSDVCDSGLSLRLPNGVTIEGINDQSIGLVSKLIAQL